MRDRFTTKATNLIALCPPSPIDRGGAQEAMHEPTVVDVHRAPFIYHRVRIWGWLRNLYVCRVQAEARLEGKSQTSNVAPAADEADKMACRRSTDICERII